MVNKLAELLKEADKNAEARGITDYSDAIIANAEFLLASGVLVPPCKIGDKFYSVIDFRGIDLVKGDDIEPCIEESEIIGILCEKGEWYVESSDGELWKVGTDLCLLDRAEAERLLKERASGKKN